MKYQVNEITNQLPDLFENIAKNMKDSKIQKGLDYYYQYVKYLNNTISENVNLKIIVFSNIS